MPKAQANQLPLTCSVIGDILYISSQLVSFSRWHSVTTSEAPDSKLYTAAFLAPTSRRSPIEPSLATSTDFCELSDLTQKVSNLGKIED